MRDARALIERMRPFPAAVRAMVGGLAESDARWKPPSGNWSILEVVCHLADEEEEDFRVRLASTLRDPALAWPALDLEGVAEKRGYNARSLGPEIDRFAREREKSLAWLASLGDPGAIDWATAYVHPKFGPIPAGDLLASWAAHDALHLRQIAKRLYELAGRDGAPHATAYAGEWGA